MHNFTWLIAGIALFTLGFATASHANVQDDKAAVKTLSRIEPEVYEVLKLAGLAVRGGPGTIKAFENYSTLRDVLELVAKAELASSGMGVEIHGTQYASTGLPYFCWKSRTHLLVTVAPGAACRLVPDLAKRNHTGDPLYFDSEVRLIKKCKAARIVLVPLPTAGSCQQHPNGIEAD